VASARQFAITDPFSLKDQAQVRENARKRIFARRQDRMEQQMRQLLSDWLTKKDQPDEH